jgi:hypothetical protein
MSDEAEVSYTVKELLSQLNNRIDTFMGLIGTKADAASVAHAHERVDVLDIRLTKVEHELGASDKYRSAMREFRRWLWPVGLSAVTAAVLILQVFHVII